MGQVGGRNMTDKILGSMAAEKSGPNSFSLFRVLLPSVSEQGGWGRCWD